MVLAFFMWFVVIYVSVNVTIDNIDRGKRQVVFAKTLYIQYYI